MSIAMERACGHFLNSSRGSIMSMMGESQGCVIKPHEVGSHADANKANNDYANMSNNYTGTYTAKANDAYAAVALERNAKVPLDVPYSPHCSPC